jgi:hypothetical protein
VTSRSKRIHEVLIIVREALEVLQRLRSPAAPAALTRAGSPWGKAPEKRWRITEQEALERRPSCGGAADRLFKFWGSGPPLVQWCRGVVRVASWALSSGASVPTEAPSGGPPPGSGQGREVGAGGTIGRGFFLDRPKI